MEFQETVDKVTEEFFAWWLDGQCRSGHKPVHSRDFGVGRKLLATMLAVRTGRPVDDPEMTHLSYSILQDRGITPIYTSLDAPLRSIVGQVVDQWLAEVGFDVFPMSLRDITYYEDALTDEAIRTLKEKTGERTDRERVLSMVVEKFNSLDLPVKSNA